MHESGDMAVPNGPAVPQREIMLLIADVAALTGVPAPQLRSWEAAGVIHPRRSPSATRLYSAEDVAQVRLIKRSLLKPGRRGSLRRIAKELAGGSLTPEPEDFAGIPGVATPAVMSDAAYWQAVVSSMGELVIVGDGAGRVTSMNPALRCLLPVTEPSGSVDEPARSLGGEPLPAVLEALPLRWSALTGTQHRDVMVMLPGVAGSQVHTAWRVSPLRDDSGQAVGAVGVGRIVPQGPALLPEDWLAVAAHDLRNPVTTILGRLQLARRASAVLHGPEAPAAQRLNDHLAMAQRSTEDLIRIMDTVLDASAATSGMLIGHLEPEGIDLGQLAQQTVERAQQQASHHSFSLEVHGGPLHVAGDRIRLQQVLHNLLANAMKYSPDGGAIQVKLEVSAEPQAPLPDESLTSGTTPDAAAGWVWVRVADNGLGIPVESVPHVFERYWRVADATHRISGTGLGLYVCRAIVAAHGGHIWVERTVAEAEVPNGDWHGTVIALVLPLFSTPGPHGAGGALWAGNV